MLFALKIIFPEGRENNNKIKKPIVGCECLQSFFLLLGCFYLCRLNCNIFSIESYCNKYNNMTESD